MPSRILNPNNPGGLLSPTDGNELTPNEELVVQAIAAGTYFQDEQPSGAVDDVNVTFTLSASPNPTTSLVLSKQGQEQIPSTEYSLSGATITFVTAPEQGTVLRAHYRVSPV